VVVIPEKSVIRIIRIKKKYQKICDYPLLVKGHCVVKWKSDDTNSSITLISFGGVHKHTLTMEYKSVWDQKNRNVINRWIRIPNKQVIGHKEQWNMEGVRALVSGKNNDLLFMTFSNSMNVINLRTFTYVANFALIRSMLAYHCFVPKTKKNKILVNKFILIIEAEAILIEYDEEKNHISESILSYHVPLQRHYQHAYACWNDFVILMGGADYNSIKRNNSVHIYGMEDNQWLNSQLILPFRIVASAAVLSQNDTCLHMIGGSDNFNAKNQHFVIKTKEFIGWTKQEVNVIIQHWSRCELAHIGWIKEFNDIVVAFAL